MFFELFIEDDIFTGHEESGREKIVLVGLGGVALFVEVSLEFF